MGTLQGLDGRLLVDTEHNRVFGRVEVQADDISDLGRECRILTHFVGAREVWLYAVGSQDIGDTAAREPDRLAQETGRPPTSPSRRGRQSELHDCLDGLSRHRVVPAAGLRTVQQPVNALPRKSSSDPRYRLRRQVEPRRDVHARFARRAPENDTCAAHQPGWLHRPRDQGFEHLLLSACRSNLVCVGHTHIRSHA